MAVYNLNFDPLKKLEIRCAAKPAKTEILGADGEISPEEAKEILKRLEELYDILASVEMEDEDGEEAAAMDELLEEIDDMMDGLRDLLEP